MRTCCLAFALILLAPALAAESWTLSTVDMAGDVGRYASIGSRFGRTHVAYYDHTNGDLKYAFTDDDHEWKTEVVDFPGDVGEYASIAVDLKGVPHISYYDATNYDLRYAVKAGPSWKIYIVDSGFAGTHTSIAVDSEFFVYISYMDMAGDNLRCVWGKHGNWQTMLVDISGSVGWGSSTAVDPKDRAHISYNDNGANKLRYATNANGSFDVAVLDPMDVAVPTAIAVDSAGAVHIAFLANGLRYTTNASGTFVTETVDDSIGQEEWAVSIALAPGDRPAIGYHDGSAGLLKLARKNEEGTWTTSVIDKGGMHNSLCVDDAGTIRIAYSDYDTDLRYAIND